MILKQQTPMSEATGEVDDAGSAQNELASLRAAALLPAQLLQGGEIIILLIKPSPWYIVLEPLRFLVATLLAWLILLILVHRALVPITAVDVTLLAIGVAAVRLVWQFMEWLSRVYVLTDQRVIVVWGVLRVQVFESQLKKIQHTITLFTIRERLFGLGTIGFTTAGTGAVEAAWRMVANPLDVHQQVVRALNRYR